ncbi:MAG: hypothetical protein Q9195_006719 [Heterodermia aff. obscurata]
MLSRVRAALIFLSVNLSAVTLQDLLEFVQNRIESADLMEGSYIEEDEARELAVESLREYLGSLVTVYPVSSRFVASASLGQETVHRDILLVELCHSSLRQLILKETEPPFGSHDEELIRSFTSTTGLAHKDAAIVCLRIATRSFQSLVCCSYYSMKAHEPPLVHYAYQFWFSHLVASNDADMDDVLVHAQEFRKRLIRDSAALIGSISLVIRSDVVDLGPNSGGISKTGGLVALESSLLQAAKALQSLFEVQYAPAYRSSHKLNNGESLMLWPANKYLKLSGIAPWNVSKESRLYERLSCAVADMLDEPSKKEKFRRLKEAEKIYTLRGSNAIIVAAYVGLNQGSGLARILKAPLLNHWLNTRVHV